MRFAGVWGVVVGLLMMGQWAFFIASGQVPEFQSEPVRITFHLAAEGTTAIMLIVGGIGLLRRRTWGRPVYLVAAGMLLYTSIVSPGYFAQQGDWSLPVMFAVLIVVTLASLRAILTSPDKTTGPHKVHLPEEA